MAQSLVKNYIHIVFSTKHQTPMIIPPLVINSIKKERSFISYKLIAQGRCLEPEISLKIATQ